MARERRNRSARRAYRPKLETLEALRLLDAAASGLLPLAIEHSALSPDPEPGNLAQFTSGPINANVRQFTEHSTWDLALRDDPLAVELPIPPDRLAIDDAQAIQSGLDQLDRYLACAWSRAGISAQQQDDCTQAVHAVVLQQLGRSGFDSMLRAIGHEGIPSVLNRDTDLGPDFFRAVDMIKKRAQRQRSFLTLDEHLELSAPVGGDDAEIWRGALHDAIDRSLNPREADLIRATLQGFSPAEIAVQWGLAPKTVSNEKTRAFQKLREALVDELGE